MADSMQELKGRQRPPRVHITYEVHSDGTPPKQEIPFAIGVMADLSGERRPLPPLSERRFVDLDPDTFERVFANAAPHLTLTVDNVLAGPGPDGARGELIGNVDFESMADFEPRNVAARISPLKELLELRDTLQELMGNLQTNTDLEKSLQRILSDDSERKRWIDGLGLSKTAAIQPRPAQPSNEGKNERPA